MVPIICWVLFYLIKLLLLGFLWCSHVFEPLEILLDNNDRVVFVTDPCSCLLQAGVLWHLLLFLFNYDFTLDESGVEKSAETNQQVRRQKEEKLNSCRKACRHCATENGQDAVYEKTSELSFSWILVVCNLNRLWWSNLSTIKLQYITVQFAFDVLEESFMNECIET